MQTAGIAREGKSVRLSVCPSITLMYCIKTKKASVMISSTPESLIILVSRNIWFITKFERGHLERGRAILETGVCTNWQFWRFFIYVDIRRGFAREWDEMRESNESGVVVNGDFRFFRSLYLPNFHSQGHNYYSLLYYVTP